MSLNSYLAVGNVVLLGDGNSTYALDDVAFPGPKEDGSGGYEPATRTIRLRVEGSSASAVSTSVTALRHACVRDNLITWRLDTSSSLLTTRIREAYVAEEYHNPITWGQSDTPYTHLTLTLTTDPHWLAPWSSETTASLTTVPGTFTIADPGGEDDALVSMRAIASASARGLFLGGMPDAAAGFDPIDDYGASGAGTSDANALTGYKVTSSWLTATMAAVGTAPAFDTNANRGTYIPIVRMDSTAASVATTAYRVVQRVTGNAISASTDVATASVTPRAIDLVATELERISVPSGAVPDVATGSGWSTESVLVEQATDDGTKTLNDDSCRGDGPSQSIHLEQTFASFAGQMTAVEYTVDTAPSKEITRAALYLWNASRLILVYYPSVPLTQGTHKVTFATPIACIAGETWAFSLMITAIAPDFTIGLAFGNNRYAAGALTTLIGSGEDADDDLVFKVYGKTLLGFNSYSIVQATDSTASSKIANLDYLVRIPVDYAALAYRLAASTAPALYYDGDTDVAYIADADGIGPAVLDKAEVIKPLRAKPGVSTTYVLATTHDDVAVGTASVTYKTRARYLSATG